MQLGIDADRKVITNLPYVDDVAVFVRDPAHWPAMFNQFELVAKSLGLKLPWQKTKAQNVAMGHLLPITSTYSTSSLIVKSMDHFTYLGSNIYSSGYCGPDVRR